MIDSHCHLTYISKKSKELSEVLERANKAGIFYFIDILYFYIVFAKIKI